MKTIYFKHPVAGTTECYISIDGRESKIRNYTNDLTEKSAKIAIKIRNPNKERGCNKKLFA